MDSPLDRFLAVLAEAGQPAPGDILSDGRIHRYDPPHGKRGRKPCWYKLHALTSGHFVGHYGDWRLGERGIEFRSWENGAAAPHQDTKRWLAEAAAARKRTDQELAAARKRTAEDAEREWPKLSPMGESQYLLRKGVRACGIKFGRDERGNFIAVPMRAGREWRGIQRIYDDGTKHFPYGTHKQGAYVLVGHFSQSGPIYLCEGYATAASLYEATGDAAIACFDAGNIAHVLQALLADRVRRERLVVCADNDQWTERGNAGAKVAWDLECEFKVRAVLPSFEGYETSGKPTDFNDLAQLAGIEEVRRQLGVLRGGQEGRARSTEQKLSASIAIDTFEGRFVSPEYLVDGIIQARYLYTLTGHSNAGKTAIAAALTCAVDSGTPFAGAETLDSPVLYLCGENVDDFRQRIMATYQEHWVHHPRKERRVHIIDHAFPIRKHFQFVLDEVDRLGGVRIIVIDTSIAYSDYEEENANAQIAEHARACRKLTRATGDPAVIVLCHPTKNATEENLIPRGGGAMLNEIDTNLTLWHDGEVSKLHHTKIRGAPFGTLAFRLRQVELVGREDTKGRAIMTVIAEPGESGTGKRRGRSPKGMPDNARIAYRALEEALESEGHQLADGTSVIPAQRRYVKVEVWRQQFNSRFGEKGNEGDSAPRMAWQRAKSFLIGHEIVKVWDDFVWSVL